MLKFRAVFVVIGFLLTMTAAPADEPAANSGVTKVGVLAVVPESVSAAVAIRNASELTRRGDVFIQRTGMKVPLRPSDAFRWLVDFLGIRKGLDDDGAFALMAMSPDVELTSLVLAVPVKDFDAMSSNLKVSRDRLKAGEVVDRNDLGGPNPMQYVRYVSVRGNHLLMGGDREKVQEAASAPALNVSLPEELQRTLSDDDIVLFARQLGADNLSIAVHRIVEGLPPSTNESQAKTVKQLTKAAMDLRSVIAGIRLDGGLGVTFALNFDGEASRDFLTPIASKSSDLELSGLPNGRTIAMHSSTGDGDKSEGLARVLIDMLFHRMMSIAHSKLPAIEDSVITDLFGVAWEDFNGSRTGLYENQNPGRDGAFNFLAILEADDAEGFVAELPGLARFVNASTMTAQARAEMIDAEMIRGLVEDLGHTKYRTRRLAAVKLELIGAPALAALNEVRDSTDTETRIRARSIIDRIKSSEADTRKAFLDSNLLAKIEPRFVYLPNQEFRSGRSVDVVRMQLLGNDRSLAEGMKMLFGPEWNVIRLTTAGQHVLFFLGTETSIMDQAIAELQTGNAGNQVEERFAAFRRRGEPKRTAEFHLSVARLKELVDRQAEVPQSERAQTAKATSSMTSFGMSIEPQTIRFDLFSPYDDTKAIIGVFE